MHHCSTTDANQCFNMVGYSLSLQDALGYKEALIHAFEDVSDGNWDAVADWDSLNAKKKQVWWAHYCCC